MNILIVFATSEGQTRKVAGFLADHLRGEGVDTALVDIASADPNLDPAGFDAVILAGRVHGGTFPRALVRFARHHAPALSARPSAFVSVSMMAARPGERARETATGYVRRFATTTGWMPRFVHHAAGARRYSHQAPLMAWIFRTMDRWTGFPLDTSRDFEGTDWAALSRFGDSFLAAVERVGQA